MKCVTSNTLASVGGRISRSSAASYACAGRPAHHRIASAGRCVPAAAYAALGASRLAERVAAAGNIDRGIVVSSVDASRADHFADCRRRGRKCAPSARPSAGEAGRIARANHQSCGAQSPIAPRRGRWPCGLLFAGDRVVLRAGCTPDGADIGSRRAVIARLKAVRLFRQCDANRPGDVIDALSRDQTRGIL